VAKTAVVRTPFAHFDVCNMWTNLPTGRHRRRLTETSHLNLPATLRVVE
jgi:hypothetical protein